MTEWKNEYARSGGLPYNPPYDSPTFHHVHPHIHGRAHCRPDTPLLMETVTDVVPQDTRFCTQCNVRLQNWKERYA